MAFDATQCPLNAFVATPSDTEIISGFGFIVPGGGDVAVMPLYQESAPSRGEAPVPVTFTGLPAGHDPILLMISRVMATGTAPTDDGNVIVFGPV